MQFQNIWFCLCNKNVRFSPIIIRVVNNSNYEYKLSFLIPKLLNVFNLEKISIWLLRMSSYFYFYLVLLLIFIRITCYFFSFLLFLSSFRWNFKREMIIWFIATIWKLWDNRCIMCIKVDINFMVLVMVAMIRFQFLALTEIIIFWFISK